LTPTKPSVDDITYAVVATPLGRCIAKQNDAQITRFTNDLHYALIETDLDMFIAKITDTRFSIQDNFISSHKDMEVNPVFRRRVLSRFPIIVSEELNGKS